VNGAEFGQGQQLLKSETTDTRIFVDESNIEDAKLRLNTMLNEQQQDKLLMKETEKSGGQFMGRLIDLLEPSITDIELGSAGSIKVLKERMSQRGVLIAEPAGNIKLVELRKSTA
jgi:hypothetical protein